MPRSTSLPKLLSGKAYEFLYKQQTKPTSVHALSPSETRHRFNLQKEKETPKYEGRFTKYFRMGHTEVHFPTASVVLLRPFRTEYNPYRASFKVPTNFNKFDLRDYLHNVYGLTVRNVFSNLRFNERTRALVKYMIVEMDEPFLYPPFPENLSPWRVDIGRDYMNFVNENSKRYGYSKIDNFRLKAMDGIGQKKFPRVKSFVPKLAGKQMKNRSKVIENYMKSALKLQEIEHK
ncbi:mitochondrial 54S ribosomal protein uL23m [Lipomyces oligophaga]|uniref:mitochondrial 54S ribosomal protein uL23m n=1 Tax=Lipomyces oligophaga TaxID=45792 RepID=UPI0034CD4B28